MAVSNGDSDDAQTETEPTVEKDVTVIGYGTDPEMDEREFASTVDDRSDYYEKRTRTTTKHYIRFEDDDGDEKEQWIGEDAYNALVGETGQRDPNANGELVEETTEKVEFKNTPSVMSRNMKRKVWSHLPDELSHGLMTGVFMGRYQDDKDETKVSIESDGVTTEKVLVHQSERDGFGEMHETDEEYPAVKLSVSLEGTEEEVEDWSAEVVKPIMEYLAGTEGIGKVRLTDCKTKVEREGDCYNL